MTKTAVILLQMGGPDSPEAVKPFLTNLFSDRDIIRIGPAWLQPLIARIIAARRTPHARENYNLIGGKSPILELTTAQAAALERELGEDFQSFLCMRYWHPFTEEAVDALKREGIRRAVAISLYPHYSRTTTGSSVNELKRVLAAKAPGIELTVVESFHDDPLYIDALAAKVRAGLETFHPLAQVEILFSAHGLPQSVIDGGDPYLAHIEETVRLVMERLGDIPYHLAFQSRAGPVKWLEPDTDDVIRHLGGHCVNNLLVVPLSFVSDHIETLYEIDLLYAKTAFQAGIAHFRRCDSLNSDPLFIRCLATLVRRALGEPA